MRASVLGLMPKSCVTSRGDSTHCNPPMRRNGQVFGRRLASASPTYLILPSLQFLKILSQFPTLDLSSNFVPLRSANCT